MARRLSGKVHVTGVLIAETPLSVGGPGTGEVDLPLAVDGRGHYYVPGTALTGALRHAAEREVCDANLVPQVFGFQEEGNPAAGHASWLVVRDGRIGAVPGGGAERRDGIGIDPVWGTAKPQAKYQREVLPRGTEVGFELELDLPAAGDHDHAFDPDQGQRLLRLLLDLLAEGKVSLGAASSRGLGRVVLKQSELHWNHYDLRDREGLIAWLQGKPKPAAPPEVGDLRQTSRPTLRISVEWSPRAPVLVKAGADGATVDMLPLVGAVGESEVAAVLPGSSLKGALRAHAERIVRTLSSDSQRPGLVETLFGSPRRAGRVAVRDVYQTGKPIALQDFQREQFGTWGRYEDHVAIDRFTGGAADQALYSVLTPPVEGWEPIQLDVRLPTESAAREAEIALLLFLLRDLAQGLIPFGFGANRGLGAVSVTSVAIDPAHVPELPRAVKIDGKGLISGVTEDSRRGLVKAMRIALGLPVAEAPGDREGQAHA